MDRQQRSTAVSEMYQRYGGAIYHKCLKLLSRPEEAEDAVQETFISAYRALESFRYGDSPLPWLYRIATNTCLSRLRSRRRSGTFPSADVERLASMSSREAAQLHARRILATAMDRLSEQDQQILVAHYVDGMSQGEVAETYQISRRSVVRRLGALRELLRELDRETADA